MQPSLTEEINKEFSLLKADLESAPKEIHTEFALNSINHVVLESLKRLTVHEKEEFIIGLQKMT